MNTAHRSSKVTVTKQVEQGTIYQQINNMVREQRGLMLKAEDIKTKIYEAQARGRRYVAELRELRAIEQKIEDLYVRVDVAKKKRDAFRNKLISGNAQAHTLRGHEVASF